jgi:hypothetical protein
MHGFLESIVRISMHFAETHPDFVHCPEQVLSPISANTLSRLILSTSEEEKMQSLRLFEEKQFATLMLDAGTIVHLHFVNFVLTRPEFSPLLVQTYTSQRLDSESYQGMCADTIDELALSNVIVTGIVADNLPCQQLALKRLVDDPRFAAISILPCGNYTLNLVFTSTLKTSEFLSHCSKSLRAFQVFVRKPEFLRRYQKICPTLPDHRWIYTYDIVQWIRHHDDIIPVMTQLFEADPEFASSVNLTEWDHGTPHWLFHLENLLAPLAKLSLQLESRKTALWQIVPMVEEAVTALQAVHATAPLRDMGDYAETVVALTYRLIARFRVTFNAEAAIAAWVLSGQGRSEVRWANRGFATEGPSEPCSRSSALEEILENYQGDHAKPGDDVPPREEEIDTFGTYLIDDEGDDASGEKRPEGEIEPANADEAVLTESESNSVQDVETMLRAFPTFQEATQGGVFQNLYNVAEAFLVRQAAILELDIDVRQKLREWVLSRDPPIPNEFLTHDPDEIWRRIAMTDAWRPFAVLALRIVSLAVSEAEVERTISVQRDILGTKGNRTNEGMLAARTRLRQRYEPGTG